MGIPREEIPWFPTVDEEKCIGCGECLDVCPNGVFEMGTETVQVIAPYNCVVLCNKCQAFCDQEAILFPDKDAFVQKLVAMARERRRVRVS